MVRPIFTCAKESAWAQIWRKLWETPFPSDLESKSTFKKFLDFVEHSWFTTIVGIVCGLIGMVYYKPILLICEVWILLTFHRAGVVRGKALGVQILAFTLLFISTGGGLYWVGLEVRQAGQVMLKDVAVVDAIKPLLNSRNSSFPLESNTKELPLSLPLVLEFHVSNSHGPKEKFLSIKNPGAVGIEDIHLEGIRYVFDLDAWKTQKLKLDFFSQLGLLANIPAVPAGKISQRLDMGKMRQITLYSWGDVLQKPEPLQDSEPSRTYYCFRFRFRDGRTKEEYVFFKVTTAYYGSPSPIEEEGVSSGGHPGQLWIDDVPEIIKADARTFYKDRIKEYEP